MFQSLEDKIKGVESAIKISYEDNMERQQKLMESWQPKISKRLFVDTKNTATKTVENQITHEKFQSQVPRIQIDGKELLDHQFVDDISSSASSAFTLFLKTDQGLVRYSTSIRNKEGKRAVDTFIPPESPVYKSMLDGKPFLGRAVVLGQWYITAYHPIFQDGKVIGAIFFGNPETSSDKIKAFLRPQKILDTGYFYILDSKGDMLLHPTKEGRNVLEDTDVKGKFIFKEIIARKNGLMEYVWLNPETKKSYDKIALFKYFPEMDWYVAAGLNVSEVEAPVAKLRVALFSITALMTLLMLGSTILFGRKVAANLQKIVEVLNLSARGVKTRTTEINSASTALASSSEQQAAALHETSAELDQIRSTVTKSLQGAQLTEKLSAAVMTQAQSGQAILQTLEHSMAHIAKKTKEAQLEMAASHRDIQKVVQVIEDIQVKTQVINDIVFQTKLLSFNASVEAARAGEHGKGFSVVAEEVGKLAAMSGSAAEEIRLAVDQNGKEVNNVVHLAQKRIDSIMESITPIINQGVQDTSSCKSTFGKIVSQIAETDQAIKSITQGAREQVKGLDEISIAMQRLNTSTEENSVVAHQTDAVATQLKENSNQMDETISNLHQFLKGA